VTTDTYQFVKETARKVIIEMGLRKVLLTPENYHLWYDYTTGANEPLTKDIDALKEANHPFTEKINRELYKRHVQRGAAVPGMAPDGPDVEAVRHAQEQTETLLKNLLSEVLETSSSAAAYNDNLKAYSSRISQAEGITELQGVVRDLLRDTAGMAKSSENLQDKLTQATHEAESLRQKLQDARQDAVVDGLTGIMNRRGLDIELAALLEEFDSKGTSFSVIMVDVDHFKPFNDTHGHPLGDEVLRQVGKMLLETVEEDGIPARYGGEEFSVLVPATGLEGARYMAERIRLCISKIAVTPPGSDTPLDPITASLGVAEVWRGDSAASVMKRADEALYLAKQSGRNQVKTEEELAAA
jgi:diguanylate cyclase